MSAKLLPIPDIPAGLREAAARTTLVPFVGAGASVLAGCPGWKDFADKSLRWLVGQGKFSYSQLDQINHLHPRVKLSLARTIANEHKTKIAYRDILHPKPPRESLSGQRLYNALFRLSTIFVTTNYDAWLDERLQAPVPTAVPTGATTHITATPMNVVYGPEQVNSALLSQPNTVIHLHGSLREPDTMIMTTSDYISQYAAYNRTSRDPLTENPVLTFLDFLFRHRTVLFIGYGLEELEILEYVLTKGPRGGGEVRHYILQGYFSHEEALLRSMDAYYRNECGIELLPFRRDEKDWEQLLDVIENFAEGMPASNPLVQQEMQDMENLLP
jgi:SIR2-like domain